MTPSPRLHPISPLTPKGQTTATYPSLHHEPSASWLQSPTSPMPTMEHTLHPQLGKLPQNIAHQKEQGAPTATPTPKWLQLLLVVHPHPPSASAAVHSTSGLLWLVAPPMATSLVLCRVSRSSKSGLLPKAISGCVCTTQPSLQLVPSVH